MADGIQGHIVAMGGGGFSMEPDNPLLDDFVLSLVRKRRPRVCFVPTASGDAPAYVARFYRALSGRCEATDLTLGGNASTLPRHPRSTFDLPAFVEAQDAFYVGGGNTAHLLALWRLHGLDKLLRRAWKGGAVMAGLSAGMLCWFEAGVTDSYGGLRGFEDGLGFVKGSGCPHYDGEEDRRAAYHRFVSEGGPPGYAADDGVALHFEGRRLKEAVSSRPSASAYRVAIRRGEVVETPIQTRYLGK